jgi:hypothetical protein
MIKYIISISHLGAMALQEKQWVMAQEGPRIFNSKSYVEVVTRGDISS